jgi:hypothetical protein
MVRNSIECHIAFFGEKGYCFDHDPGVCIEPLSQYGQMDHMEICNRLKNIRKNPVFIDSLTCDETWDDLASNAAKALGFPGLISHTFNDVKWGFLQGETIYFIDDINAKALSSFNTYPNSFLFIMYNSGAEYFHSNKYNANDEAVKYTLRPKERKHNIPHIHVDYRHEATASVRISPCEFLEESGHFPGKVRKAIISRITDNMELLLTEWNRMTKGVHADLDVCLGKAKVTR